MPRRAERTVDGPATAGLSCAVCGAHIDITEPMSWRCPNATTADRHHALRFVERDAPLLDQPADASRPVGSSSFAAFRTRLAWDSFAAAQGVSASARQTLVAELHEQVVRHAGCGVHITPFARHDELSEALGFTADGGVWLKDETGQVGGSHKARHLFGILLHLRTVEHLGRAPWMSAGQRPSLAIASCGNAAVAAVALAGAVGWPIQVFVPPWADPTVAALLDAGGADVVACPRRDDDPPGDPCVHRFREAVAGGAVPFSAQGTENVWCLDGGRTIGWEMAAQLALTGARLDAVFVQVGGGALAACVAQGLERGGVSARLHAVQTAGCAPLDRAWHSGARDLGADRAAHWSELMRPWSPVIASAADGILDDETYDWLPVVDAMARSGGSTVVVSEAEVVAAHDRVARTTGIDVSATGTAGLAGLLAVRLAIADDARVAVVLSGSARG